MCFVVAGQAAVVHEPAERSLDGPPPRQDGEAAGGGVAADDVHVDAQRGGVFDEVLAAAAVDPGLSDRGMLCGDSFDEGPAGNRVLHARTRSTRSPSPPWPSTRQITESTAPQPSPASGTGWSTPRSSPTTSTRTKDWRPEYGVSLHCATLMILHRIDYRGSYQRQIQLGGWAGNTQPVPWVDPTTALRRRPLSHPYDARRVSTLLAVDAEQRPHKRSRPSPGNHT